jgi:hypothetical protein
MTTETMTTQDPAPEVEAAAPVEAAHDTAHAPRPYWNPYLSGFGLGLVLLTAFVTMGRGLGGSSAFASAAGALVTTVAPEYSKTNSYLVDFIGANPFKEWLVFEVMGVFIGGMLSGLLANRSRFTVEHGPRSTRARRLVLAFVGGGIMALGAKLAGGCTSGQALTGGALLNAGSWAFMGAMFIGAYGFAYFLRKQWI